MRNPIFETRSQFNFQREQWLPAAIDEGFFSQPENLQVITPAWLDFQTLETPGTPLRY